MQLHNNRANKQENNDIPLSYDDLLPYNGGQRAHIFNIYDQRSFAFDRRTKISPDLPLEKKTCYRQHFL